MSTVSTDQLTFVGSSLFVNGVKKEVGTYVTGFSGSSYTASSDNTDEEYLRFYLMKALKAIMSFLLAFIVSAGSFLGTEYALDQDWWDVFNVSEEVPNENPNENPDENPDEEEYEAGNGQCEFLQYLNVDVTECVSVLETFS